MSVKVNTQATLNSLEQYKQEMTKKLTALAEGVSYHLVEIAVDTTPYGTLNERYFAPNQRAKYFKPQVGLAKGSWSVGLGTMAQSLEVYDNKSGSKAKSNATTTLENFKLGQTICISNSLIYVTTPGFNGGGSLEQGYSSQAPDGITKPTLQKIKAVYKIDMQRILETS